MSKQPTGIHVLVVDDEDDMCWVLRQIVVAEGHRCMLAKTGHEAVQAVGRELFDLAFVDVKLTDMNGFDLVRRIHQLAADLPCVLVSGFVCSDDDLVQDGLASGLIAGFVGKPFLLAQILDVLEDVAAGAARRVGESDAVNGGKRIPPGGIGSPCDPAVSPVGRTPPRDPAAPKVITPQQLEK